ncbi:FxsA family protein, partial [Acinetobacter baumannii]
MPTMMIVFLLMFVALPLLEIALLNKVASLIGIWLTFAIIVGTAVLGFNVAQQQGLGVARRMA